MDAHTDDIREAERPTDKARYLWNHTTVRRHVHPALISVLVQMAPGHERCMYCGDNQGTDIDHFEPLTLAPLRTFAWPNHLLACSLCNSHYKRHIFPRDEGGRPLLLDPTIEDPLEHLHLILGVGRYEALSPQGTASIDVFGLNRGSLLKGRLDAYRTAGLFLTQWRNATHKRQYNKARDVVRIAWDRPLADVLAAMFHQSALPVAESLFDGEDDVLELLCDPSVREGFLGGA
ncbi:HNH endonuclease [Streptomyces sp. NPDC002785]|uniref:HNH endonuclease n=1 Tax=Streptomyces sp. NPDC002785 TaxID=3154543 RepID=UPI00332CC468